ncbi:hypothetical protein J8273_0623 [Carpediemonas membranifera]|uniref:Uncharacterized protein n=1 Tax=Carpediemonas membranifera TaxID=201153 RepID=A0A8J6E4Q8_9EUKA|nr:hypothetical protein J8273_0623 [Carpediemonas membranifera]|eukprot:KAG9397493.1 hypothetical protein J8273_0623 [Carpediemonas membranifera]
MQKRNIAEIEANSPRGDGSFQPKISRRSQDLQFTEPAAERLYSDGIRRQTEALTRSPEPDATFTPKINNYKFRSSRSDTFSRLHESGNAAKQRAVAASTEEQIVQAKAGARSAALVRQTRPAPVWDRLAASPKHKGVEEESPKRPQSASAGSARLRGDRSIVKASVGMYGKILDHRAAERRRAEEMEQQECTFRPTKFSTPKGGKTESIQVRTKHAVEEKQARLLKARELKQDDEMRACTFSPDLNKSRSPMLQRASSASASPGQHAHLHSRGPSSVTESDGYGYSASSNASAIVAKGLTRSGLGLLPPPSHAIQPESPADPVEFDGDMDSEPKRRTGAEVGLGRGFKSVTPPTRSPVKSPAPPSSSPSPVKKKKAERTPEKAEKTQAKASLRKAKPTEVMNPLLALAAQHTRATSSRGHGSSDSSLPDNFEATLEKIGSFVDSIPLEPPVRHHLKVPIEEIAEEEKRLEMELRMVG